MIIESIMNLFWKMFSTFFDSVSFPVLPDIFFEYWNRYVEILLRGVGLIGIFIPLDLFVNCVAFCWLVMMCIYAYKIIMWVIKKIPILNIH